jgi:hypothetical protein
MYKKLLFPLFAIMIFVTACHSGSSQAATESNSYTPPAAGTIVAADSMAVTSDPLNHFSFSVKVVATQYSKTGTYDVVAAWGPDVARATFTMPQGAGNLKPILQKGKDPNTYIIGFHYGNDKKFYDYYQISDTNGQIEMKYTKGYSFK